MFWLNDLLISMDIKWISYYSDDELGFLYTCGIGFLLLFLTFGIAYLIVYLKFIKKRERGDEEKHLDNENWEEE